MTTMEQLKNVQQYGVEGGQMNLEAVEKEIIDHRDGERRKKQQEKENTELIKKLFFEVVKVSGSAAVEQAIKELLIDFNM